MMRTGAGRGALAGALLLSLAALAGCGSRGNGAKAGDAAPAGAAAMLGADDVARVGRADLVAGIPVSGTLAPAVDIRITAPLAEVLEAVVVKEGQTVRRGDELARFRTEALAPAAASAEAARQVAAADYERMKNLFAEGAVSRHEVESAEAGFKAAEANEAYARKRFAEATVRAPADGAIAERSVQSGDRVGEGDPLFRLVNTRELEFEATVPGEYAGGVHVGSRVLLGVAGRAAESISGIVSRVNATADPATRQVRLYVAVPNEDGRLVGDIFASGRIVTEERKRVLAAPFQAVRTDGTGRSFALVVEQGKIARCEVATGLRDEAQEMVEITSGLPEGAQVVVGQTEGLTVGQAVQVAGQEG